VLWLGSGFPLQGDNGVFVNGDIGFDAQNATCSLGERDLVSGGACAKLS
jgi:hypothetical protein